MKTVKKYSVLFVSLILASFGIALAIKAGIGLAAFDAFNQTVSDVSNIQVGTILMFAQIFFVITQILILRKEASWKILLQIPLVILLGQFINLFIYQIFADLVLKNYLIRLLIFIFSQLWLSFFISVLLVLDLIAMPIENLALILSTRLNFTVSQIRQAIDIILIVLAFILTMLFSVPLNVREGTLLSALIFGPMLGIYMPVIFSCFSKWGLLEEKGTGKNITKT